MGDEEQQQEKKREERELREVRHQLDRLREEHSELLRTVSVTEDLVTTMTDELDTSKKKEASLVMEVENADTVLQEMKVATRKLKEEMDSLTLKNEQLNMEICSQEEQMEDKNQQVITGKGELEEIMEKEINTKDELA